MTIAPRTGVEPPTAFAGIQPVMTAHGVTLDELLAHERFLRAVAARLVARDDVDDLVQRTWLATAQGGPRRPGRLRAWLATVARNLAGKLKRETARRVRREEAATPRAPLPTPEQLADREAMRRAVADAVLALAPDLREAVLLRWYEGMSARDAAAHVGVPVETFRTRLKRAHARLRNHLDDRYGGTNPWASVALALGGSGLARGSAATTVMEGVLVAMQTKVAVAACVVVLAGVGSWWWMRDVGPSSSPQATAQPMAADDELARRSNAGNGSQATPAVTVAIPFTDRDGPAASGPVVGSLRARVSWPDGTAAAGVTVGFLHPGRWGGQPQSRTTDAMGLTGPIVDTPATFSLRVDRGQRWVAATIEPGHERIVDYRLDPGTAVSGQVLDGDDRPISDAEILVSGDGRVPQVVARTTSDGSYAARDVHAELSLFAHVRGRAPAAPQRVGGGTGRPVERNFRITTDGASVTGTVRSSNGTALAGVRVFASPETTAMAASGAASFDLAVETRTNDSGQFRVDSLPAGPCNVVAYLAGFAIGEARVDAEVGQAATASITLFRESRLVGTARGLSPDRLRIQVAGSGPFSARATTAAPDGTYSLDGILPGRRLVRARDSAQQHATTTLEFPEGGELRWDPPRNENLRVHGRVVDRHEHVVHASVHLYRRVESRLVDLAARPVDGQGRFSFAVPTPAPAALCIDVRDPESGRTLAPLEDVAPGDTEYTIVVADELVPSAHIRGLLLASDGKPATDGYVQMFAGACDASRALRPDPQTGRFEAGGALPPGRYTLVFEWGDARIPIPLGSRELQAHETWDLGEIRVPVVGRAAVRVQSEAGADEPSRPIGVFLQDGTPLGPCAMTSSASEFVFEAAPGRYWVVVSGDSSRAPALQEIEIRSETTIPVTLRRAAGVDVQIAVPPRTAAVVALNEAGALLAIVGIDGTAEPHLRLSPGMYRLEARASESEVYRQRVVVPAGVTTFHATIERR